MKIIECEQGSPEWFAARLGIPTASEFDKILTPAKLDRSRSDYGYMCKLLAEWLMGYPADSYTNEHMERGKELEAEAREYYEMLTDSEVGQVGFCLEDGGRFGCSPDGLVGNWGILEIKCPTPGVHVGYLLDGGLPVAYRLQCLGALLVTGREWVDFLSYHPDLDPLLVRMNRADEAKALDTLAKALDSFCGVLETRRDYLTEKGYRPRLAA